MSWLELAYIVSVWVYLSLNGTSMLGGGVTSEGVKVNYISCWEKGRLT